MVEIFFFDQPERLITRVIHLFLGPRNWLLYSWAVDSIASCRCIRCSEAPDIYRFSSMCPAGITSVLTRGRKESVCGASCVYSLEHTLKVHRFGASIGFPPPFILPGTHIWVWINGANWGFDRTNSHLLMSHTGHWMLLMLQLKRPPRREVCKHLVLLFRSQLSGELYSISPLKLYVSDLNCKLWLNVISSFHFFSYALRSRLEEFSSHL